MVDISIQIGYYTPRLYTQTPHIPTPEAEASYLMTRDKDRRILIVDDDEQVRNYCAHALKIKKYLVETAESGEEAIKMLRDAEKPYDLVLSDVNMPNGNGKDVAREVCLRHASTTKVIMMTGALTDNQPLEELLVEFPEIRVEEKPLKPMVLLQAVAAVLHIATIRPKEEEAHG